MYSGCIQISSSTISRVFSCWNIAPLLRISILSNLLQFVSNKCLEPSGIIVDVTTLLCVQNHSFISSSFNSFFNRYAILTENTDAYELLRGNSWFSQSEISMNSAYFIGYPDIVALPIARHESIRKIMQTTIHDLAKIIRFHTYSDMQLSDEF